MTTSGPGLSLGQTQIWGFVKALSMIETSTGVAAGYLGEIKYHGPEAEAEGGAAVPAVLMPALLEPLGIDYVKLSADIAFRAIHQGRSGFQDALFNQVLKEQAKKRPWAKTKQARPIRHILTTNFRIGIKPPEHIRFRILVGGGPSNVVGDSPGHWHAVNLNQLGRIADHAKVAVKSEPLMGIQLFFGQLNSVLGQGGT